MIFKKTSIYISAAILVLAGLYFFNRASLTEKVDEAVLTPDPGREPNREVPVIYAPINNPGARVTKKHFGLKVSAETSPVQPERFSGYHTGVDFETFENEQDVDVTIFAVCSGELLLKQSASGYGGVAVQKCRLKGEDVTVVYGHLRLTSILGEVGSTVEAGERIGFLGKGYSSETDGERRHLHLGIHKGDVVNIRGYVQSQAELLDWLDAEKYL